MKHCPRCDQEKPLSEFYRQAASSDGYKKTCKACLASGKSLTEKTCRNPACGTRFAPRRADAETCSRKCSDAWNRSIRTAEQRRTEAKRYSDRYPEATRARKRRWYARAGAAYHQEWKRRNPEKVKANRRRNSALYRLRHPEMDKAAKIAARARRRNAPGAGVTGKDWLEILSWAKNRCCYCEKQLNDGVHMEHVIPLSRGGWHDVINVVPACPNCNLSKSTRTPTEWKPDWTPPWWIELMYDGQ